MPDSQTDETRTSIIDPVMDHDDFSFDQLSESYNFRNVSDRSRLFARLIIKELQSRPQPRAVADAGCGLGLGRGKHAADYVRAIAPHCEHYTGIEPDPGIQPEHGQFDEFQTAFFEDSKLEDGKYDVIYSFLVMEHVTNPQAFIETAYKALKPGGVFMFMTMNQKHYFTRIASLLHTLKIDEPILRMVHGKQTETYHYPVAYKFNDPQAITAMAQKVGFDQADFAFTEVRGPKSYFPGPLKPFYNWRTRSRVRHQDPSRLLELYGRIRKPVSA